MRFFVFHDFSRAGHVVTTTAVLDDSIRFFVAESNKNDYIYSKVVSIYAHCSYCFTVKISYFSVNSKSLYLKVFFWTPNAVEYIEINFWCCILSFPWKKEFLWLRITTWWKLYNTLYQSYLFYWKTIPEFLPSYKN